MAIMKYLNIIVVSLFSFSAIASEPVWIGPSQGSEWAATCPAPCFVKTLELAKAPAKATAEIAAAGWFELRVNGRKAGENVLEPVTCQPDRRISLVVHDIAPLLKAGRNEIEITVANGWYGCAVPKEVWGFKDARWHKGVPPSFKGMIEIDGKTVAVSDGSWQVYDTPIVFSALRAGEYYDARREGTRHNLRLAAVLEKTPMAKVSPDDSAPCRLGEVFEPVEKIDLGKDGAVYDFRRNLAGWCEIEVEGEAGAKVTIDYNETFDRRKKRFSGMCVSLCKGPMPSQHDEYTLSGKGVEKWHPRFVYHGFRYVQIRTSGNVKVRSVKSREISSFVKPTGTLKTSDANFTTLQAACMRSYKSNFVGIPTDCPHREKNGWTGDAQLACETGLWNFDSKKGYEHFVRMMIDAQRPNGQVPCILPTSDVFFGYGWGTGPAWDVALFEITKRVYIFTGDDTLAKEAYPAMKKYIEFAWKKRNKEGLFKYGLGDWCAPKGMKSAPNTLTDTAYVWYMHKELEFWAKKFGDGELAKKMASRAAEIKKAFNRKYYAGDGVYGGKELTALAAPLYFKGLCADSEEKKVAAVLADEVRKGGWKCRFGIFGSKWVPRMLAEYGYENDAWKLVTADSGLGFMNFVKNGYDCLWETYDGRASRNHIMFGDFSAWGYEYVAGIKILEPGFRKIAFRPHFIDGVESFEAECKTPRGTVKAGWKRGKDGKPVFSYDVPKGIEVVK